MPDQNEPHTIGNLADRPAADGNADETILAGAPDGQPWADESAAGRDMGSAAANAGYKDSGARGVDPNVEGFIDGTDPGAAGTSDLGASTSGNGPGNISTNIAGADPTRMVDQSSSVDNVGNPGASILEDDAEADQGGFKGA